MKKTFITKTAPLFAALVVSGALTTAWAQAPATTGSTSAGGQKAAMCIGCHGIPGYQSSFPEVHKVPMLGGQNAKYIASALGAYQKGDRRHPTMRAIAASLTDQDILDLAAFYESQGAGAAVPPTPSAPSSQVATLLDKGKCITCHGDNFSKTTDPSYPKLAGQHKDYLYSALKSYHTTGNPLIGRNNATMATQVQNFNPAELKTLADYLGSLPGQLKTEAQSRFR